MSRFFLRFKKVRWQESSFLRGILFISVPRRAIRLEQSLFCEVKEIHCFSGADCKKHPHFFTGMRVPDKECGCFFVAQLLSFLLFRFRVQSLFHFFGFFAVQRIDKEQDDENQNITDQWKSSRETANSFAGSRCPGFRIRHV